MGKGKQRYPLIATCPPMITRDSFVEFETAADLNNAVEKLDGQEYKGSTVSCKADVSFERIDITAGPFPHMVALTDSR